MAQISKFLRQSSGGYAHWCPGCEQMHHIPVEEPHPNGCRWTFDCNAESPSFAPSVNFNKKVCHYYLTDGKLIFQNDCTHLLKGQTVLLPELPKDWQDE